MERLLRNVNILPQLLQKKNKISRRIRVSRESLSSPFLRGISFLIEFGLLRSSNLGTVVAYITYLPDQGKSNTHTIGQGKSPKPAQAQATTIGQTTTIGIGMSTEESEGKSTTMTIGQGKKTTTQAQATTIGIGMSTTQAQATTMTIGQGQKTTTSQPTLYTNKPKKKNS